MSAEGTKVYVDETTSIQKLSFLLTLFKTAAVKQGSSSHRILTWEIFLWIGAILLSMSARHKRVS